MKTGKDGLGFVMSDLSRLMRRAFAQRFADGPLTMAQARALVFVAHHEGVRQVDLAELLDVQPITLARLIDQLAESGLVERRADPTDRRAYQIHLLPAAQPHLRAIEQVAQTIRAEAVGGLDPVDVETTLRVLRAMRANLMNR